MIEQTPLMLNKELYELTQMHIKLETQIREIQVKVQKNDEEEQKLRTLFWESKTHFDFNSSSAELRHVLSNLGEKLTGAKIDTLIGDQEDQFGNINYDKFIKTIMHDKEGSPEGC